MSQASSPSPRRSCRDHEGLLITEAAEMVRIEPHGLARHTAPRPGTVLHLQFDVHLYVSPAVGIVAAAAAFKECALGGELEARLSFPARVRESIVANGVTPDPQVDEPFRRSAVELAVGVFGRRAEHARAVAFQRAPDGEHRDEW